MASAREDLDRLVAEALEVARLLVEKQGGLVPFGLAMGERGGVTHVGGYAGRRADRASVQALVEAGLKRPQARAVALALDVVVDGRQDAIRVDAEHREGLALQALAPYERLGWRRRWRLGEPEVTETTTRRLLS